MATATTKKTTLPKPGKRKTFEQAKANAFKKFGGALAKLAK
jgi:hypothetical protein